MKAEITADGTLVVSAETDLESFALQQWIQLSEAGKVTILYQTTPLKEPPTND